MELKSHEETCLNTYQPIDFQQISKLEQQHRWLTAPLYAASDTVLKMPFYSWLEDIDNAKAFGKAAKQLYYHSATFPKVLGLMLALSSQRDNGMMPFYAKHIFGEADHYQLLLQWMLQNGIINQYSDVESVILTAETNACINLAYRLAAEQDKEKWLVAINSGIERCSNHFFQRASKKMHAIGAGHVYFDVHVEADEHHSIMGLSHIDSYAYDSVRGQQLIAIALEAVSLWAAMLHSWIDISIHPKFNLQGDLIAL